MISIKRFLFVAFLLCSLNPIKSNPLNLSDYGYPSYKEVLNNFFKEYSGNTLIENDSFRFAKKPDGWHVQVIELYNHNNVVADEMFWCRAKKEYMALNFQLKLPTEDNDKLLKQYADEWSPNYFFNCLPYFNYEGYEWDIINELKDKPDLSDTLLNALARAYTFHAADLLNNHSSFSDASKRFNLPEGQNCLTAEQLNTYREFEHLGIQTYYKLYKQNPKFENFVADIFNVYSNEVMNCFLYLRTYQNEEEARKELIPGLYDRYFIDMAKNYLNSCAKDAILFTNGDSDTYPLLYVQSQLGFRTDVLVVNVSLLGSARYISHLYNKINDAQPILLCNDKQLYREGGVEYAYVLNKDSSVIDLRKMLNMVASKDTSVKLKYSGIFYDVFPSSKTSMAIDRNTVLVNNTVCSNDTGLITNSIKWDLKRQAIYKNELVMLDIIECNKFKRPIYFASTLASEVNLGLDNYFQLDGLANRLVPIYTPSDSTNTPVPHINADLLYQRLTKDYSYDYLLNTPAIFGDAHYRFLSNQRTQYASLANTLIKKGELVKADSILSLGLRLNPYKEIPDYSLVDFVEDYYLLKNYKKANMLAESVFNTNYQFVMKEVRNRAKDDYQIRLSKYTINKLDLLTNNDYPQKELGKKIRKAKEKLKKLYDNKND